MMKWWRVVMHYMACAKDELIVRGGCVCCVRCDIVVGHLARRK